MGQPTPPKGLHLRNVNQFFPNPKLKSLTKTGGVFGFHLVWPLLTWNNLRWIWCFKSPGPQDAPTWKKRRFVEKDSLQKNVKRNTGKGGQPKGKTCFFSISCSNTLLVSKISAVPSYGKPWVCTGTTWRKASPCDDWRLCPTISDQGLCNKTDQMPKTFESCEEGKINKLEHANIL